LATFRNDLPPELVQIVGRMMAKDPAQRFQTPAEVAKALLAFRKPGAMTDEPVPPAAKQQEAVPTYALVDLSPPATADNSGHAAAITASPLHAEKVRTYDEPSSVPVRARSVRRRNRSIARPNRRPIVIGVAIGAGCLLLMGSVLVAFLLRGGANGAGLPKKEGEGQVSVLSKDPHIQVAIYRGKDVVGTIGQNINSQITLPAGEYELKVVDGAPELRGFTGRLSLGRGDRKIVEVRLEGVFIRDFIPGFPPPKGPPPKLPPGK
jgi:hypothetical protein